MARGNLAVGHFHAQTCVVPTFAWKQHSVVSIDLDTPMAPNAHQALMGPGSHLKQEARVRMMAPMWHQHHWRGGGCHAALG
jgi:hypothetical protein